MKRKPYFIAQVSFIYALISLLPLPVLILSYSLNIPTLLKMVGNLASYSVFLALITGSYSIYKIKKNKLKGLNYAIPGTLVPLLLLIIIFAKYINYSN